MRTGAAAGTTGTTLQDRSTTMRGIFRGLLAGWGASRLGGGCISTIIIFLILWWILRGVGI
jgi:hypothetical protein